MWCLRRWISCTGNGQGNGAELDPTTLAPSTPTNPTVFANPTDPATAPRRPRNQRTPPSTSALLRAAGKECAPIVLPHRTSAVPVELAANLYKSMHTSTRDVLAAVRGGVGVGVGGVGVGVGVGEGGAAGGGFLDRLRCCLRDSSLGRSARVMTPPRHAEAPPFDDGSLPVVSFGGAWWEREGDDQPDEGGLTTPIALAGWTNALTRRAWACEPQRATGGVHGGGGRCGVD